MREVSEPNDLSARDVLARYPALPDASAIDYRRTIAPRLLRRCYLRAVST